MTSEELVKLVNEGREVWPEQGKYGFAPTLEMYCNFTSAGQRQEGELIGVWFTSANLAIEWLRRWLLIYKNKTPGMVYWRQYPALRCEEFFKLERASTLSLNIDTKSILMHVPLYIASCRLLISEKPIAYSDERSIDETPGTTEH